MKKVYTIEYWKKQKAKLDIPTLKIHRKHVQDNKKILNAKLKAINQLLQERKQ